METIFGAISALGTGALCVFGLSTILAGYSLYKMTNSPDYAHVMKRIGIIATACTSALSIFALIILF